MFVRDGGEAETDRRQTVSRAILEIFTPMMEQIVREDY